MYSREQLILYRQLSHLTQSHYGLTITDLLSGYRTEQHNKARAALIYLCATMGIKDAALAEFLVRERSTITNIRHRARMRLQTDQGFYNDVHSIAKLAGLSSHLEGQSTQQTGAETINQQTMATEREGCSGLPGEH